MADVLWAATVTTYLQQNTLSAEPMLSFEWSDPSPTADLTLDEATAHALGALGQIADGRIGNARKLDELCRHLASLAERVRALSGQAA